MLFGWIGRPVALLLVPVVMFLASCGLFRTTSAPPGIGHEVLDGNFAFIVTRVDTSPTFGHMRAQGVYVIVSMAVRNVGKEAQFFEWAAQKLRDSDGRGYSASSMDPALFGDNVVNSIEPGLQVNIKLAFDVQAGTKATQIVLHDSQSSAGTPVSLT